MQPLVTTAQWTLLAKGQQPKIKLEIEIAAGVWINICSLWDPAAGKLKNYLKDVSFTSGGARMTPDPIAGEFSAVINNKGNIFHPYHPNSGRQGYFRAGRKVRISLGGNYPASGPWAGGDEYWQRIIGHMDEPEFSSDTFEVTIKGLDYMRVLSDTKFNKEIICSAPGCSSTPIDNYWGDVTVEDSVTTAGAFGGELYALGDAMDIAADAPNVAGWLTSGAVAFVSAAPGGAPSVNIGSADIAAGAGPHWIERPNVVGLTAGLTYRFDFRYRRPAGTSITVSARQAAGICGEKTITPTDALWHQDHIDFVALQTGNLRIYIQFNSVNFQQWRFDLFSVTQITPAAWHRYPMPPGCTGIYYVELDEGAGFLPVWPGKQKGEGWYYDELTNQFYFDEDKILDTGTANLRIYFYTAQMLEWVISDILVKSGINNYANRAAAWADMGNPPTGIRIDRVWFKAGTTYTEAIKKICERCEPKGWTFYFDWAGKPRFVPIPSPGVAVFVPFLPEHIKSPKIHQDTNEIRNKIVIEGEKKAELVGWEENMPSELRDEASDNASILTYGEHTRIIKNDLFQDLASITNMCTNLLAEYKDPKWYFDFDMPYNAVPLVLGDTIQVSELLDINLAIGIRFAVHTCIIRESDISLYDVTYRCQI